MKQDISITKSINYLAIFFQSIFLLLLYLLFIQSGSDEPLVWSAMIYLSLAYSLRYFVPVDHRKGLRELNAGHYEAALNSFSNSYEFFNRYKWIDKYRSLTVFSASSLTYREIALLCKAQILEHENQDEEAKACYEKCLKEFPGNKIALEALKML
jgi:hypothetical protein